MSCALYAGSFDPPTHGHLAVIRDALHSFDQLVVVVADNPQKEPLFTPGERVRLLDACVQEMALLPEAEDRLSIVFWSGLTVECASLSRADCLVRGVRDDEDLATEFGLMELNRRLAPNLPTVLIPAPKEVRTVSSTALKRAALNGVAHLSELCPAPVRAPLLARLHTQEAR